MAIIDFRRGNGAILNGDHLSGWISTTGEILGIPVAAEQPFFDGDGTRALGHLLQYCNAFPFQRWRSNPETLHAVRYIRAHPLLPHELASVVTCVVKDLPATVLLPPDQRVRLIDEDTFPLNTSPPAPVVRLMKRQHVEQFFATGTLRVGSFGAYRHFDHIAIGDETEGSFVLAAESLLETTVVAAVSGYNHHLLCCTLAPFPRALAERFGYDAGFEVKDVRAFADIIAEALDAHRFDVGLCQYHEGRAVWSRLKRGDTESPHRVLSRLNRKSKYYMKPPALAWQREFRFVWQVRADVDGFRTLEVPNARKYCRPFRV